MSGQNPSFPYGSKIYTDADFSVPDTPDRVVEPYAGGTRFFKPFSQSEQPLQELGLLDVTRPPFCADMTGIQDATKALRDCICKKFNFASLEFQTLEGVIKAIGIDPCELCTYCWNGEED